MLANETGLENSQNNIRLKSSDLDDGLKASGSNHKYQYFLMFSFFFMKIVTDSFYAPMPYFFMDPKINCLDDLTKTYSKPCIFSEVCKFNKGKPVEQQKKYQLAEATGTDFSWVTSFNIYFDTFK